MGNSSLEGDERKVKNDEKIVRNQPKTQQTCLM